MRALLAALVSLLFAAVAPSAVAQGDGSLTRVGCLGTPGQPDCARARAIGDPRGVAVSRGGGSVYVISARSDAVAVFRRSRRTGALRQLRGRAGCVRDRAVRGCRRARALRNPSAVVVSPDGRNVYVASVGSRAIAVFRRNRRTGALHRLGGRAACVRERADVSCRDGQALAGLSSLALSPNGRVLYAGTTGGVATFARDRRAGALTQVGAGDGSFTGVAELAIDPSGSHLYASSPGDMEVAVFDVSGGVPSPAGCINQSGAGGCTAGRTLNGASGLALSPDGGQLYAAAEFSGAVAILTRDRVSGALSQPAGPLGCIRDGGGLDCAEAQFMGHPSIVEVSHDGRNAYVRAEGGDLVALSRNPATGELSQLPGRKGCLARGNPDCTERGRLAVGAVALSGDGRSLYVTSEPGLVGGAIAIYRRAR